MVDELRTNEENATDEVTMEQLMQQYDAETTDKYQRGKIVEGKVIDENEEVAAFGIVLPSICNALIKNKGKLVSFLLFINLLIFIDFLYNPLLETIYKFSFLSCRNKYNTLFETV